MKSDDDGVSPCIKRRHVIWDLDKLFIELKLHWDNHLHGAGVCPENGQERKWTVNGVQERVELCVQLVMDGEKKMWVLPKELTKDAPDLTRKNKMVMPIEPLPRKKRPKWGKK